MLYADLASFFKRHDSGIFLLYDFGVSGQQLVNLLFRLVLEDKSDMIFLMEFPPDLGVGEGFVVWFLIFAESDYDAPGIRPLCR